jgi:hypothetical protein
MAYVKRPFEYWGMLINQVEHDLNIANDNFEILGNAFYQSDPQNQPINRACYISNTPPLNPKKGQIWVNTSFSPPVYYVYDGTNWVDLSNIELLLQLMLFIGG